MLLMFSLLGLLLVEEPPIHEVCTVLNQLDRLNGSVVLVRGQFVSSSEIVGLYGKDCRGSQAMAGRQWAWALGVKGRSGCKLSDKFSEIVRAASCKESGCKISVTFLARIVTSEDVLRGKTKEGGPVVGFGHLGVFPAELHCAEAREIVITFDEAVKEH